MATPGASKSARKQKKGKEKETKMDQPPQKGPSSEIGSEIDDKLEEAVEEGKLDIEKILGEDEAGWAKTVPSVVQAGPSRSTPAVHEDFSIPGEFTLTEAPTPEPPKRLELVRPASPASQSSVNNRAKKLMMSGFSLPGLTIPTRPTTEPASIPLPFRSEDDISFGTESIDESTHEQPTHSAISYELNNKIIVLEGKLDEALRANRSLSKRVDLLETELDSKTSLYEAVRKEMTTSITDMVEQMRNVTSTFRSIKDRVDQSAELATAREEAEHLRAQLEEFKRGVVSSSGGEQASAGVSPPKGDKTASPTTPRDLPPALRRLARK